MLNYIRKKASRYGGFISGPESPVLHLFKTNEAPTDAELSSIRNAISQAESEARELRTAFLTVESPLPEISGSNRPLTEKELRRKLEGIEIFITQHRIILSSHVRRLPMELLQLIFHYHFSTIVPQSRDDSEFGRILHSHLPWNVSHVCRSWRVVAFSTPELWVYFPTIILDSPFTKSKLYLSSLKEITRLSLSLPIHLQIDGKDYEGKHTALSFLCDHSSRWCSLHLLDCTSIYNYLDSAIKDHIPLLSRVKIEHCIPVKDAPPPRFYQFLENAPSLIDVCLLDTETYAFALPSFNIRKLRYRTTTTEGISNRDVQVMTSCSTTLTHLILRFKKNIYISPGTIFHSLVLLEVTFTRSHPDSLLNNINTPNIEDLKLNSSRDTLVPAVHALLQRANSLSRNGSKLRRLSLGVKRFLPGQVTGLLVEAPNLQSMICEIPDVTDIEALTTTRNLAPRLASVGFYIPTKFGVDVEKIEALKRFADTRCNIERIAHSHSQQQVRRLDRLFLHAPLGAPNGTMQNLQQVMHRWGATNASEALGALRTRLSTFMPPFKMTENVRAVEISASILQAIEAYPVKLARDIVVCYQLHLVLFLRVQLTFLWGTTRYRGYTSTC